MFKSAATKIAHSSTLPSIGGNKDLRPLQDLITAEKAVLVSLQKLSLDFTKASEALKTWGMGEGDDLWDTLSGSAAILVHFSHALAQYASHEQSIREHMKAVRTREEGLDDLKRRRKSVAANADSAEKKLNKMSPEHKNLATQTDTLHRLRDEIRQLDTEIMTEEARLSDFKRSTTRTFMGLKYGGLQALCSKGTIVGDFGKQITAEIPDEVTQPGLPRNFYNGHSKTKYCVSEVQRYVDQIIFSGHISPADPSSPRSMDFPTGGTVMPTGAMDPGDRDPSSSTPYLAVPQFDGNNGGSIWNSPQSNISEPDQRSPSQLFAASTQNQNYTQSQSVDDFGVPSLGQLSPRLGVGAGGGRFATFPLKAANLPSANVRDDAPLSLGTGYSNRTASLSFSSQVEQALSSPVHSSLGNVNKINSNRLTPGGTGFDDPVPVYEATPSLKYSASPGPPPGEPGVPLPDPPPVAGSHMMDPWTEGQGAEHTHDSHEELETPPRTSADEAGDVHLAYMSSASDFYHGAPDRRVKFGAVSDMDQEMMDRRQNKEDIGNEEQATPPREEIDEASIPTPTTPSPPNDVRPRRMPVPVAVDDSTDENSLNAAAAREVSREMDALTFSPPSADRTSSSSLEPPPPSVQNVTAAGASVSADLLPVATSQPGRDMPDEAGYQIQYTASNSIPPPQISLSDRSVSSFSNTGSSYRNPLESPLRTPREYISALGNRSPTTGSTNKSTSSLPSAPLAPGKRTIPAAAFKRTSPRIMSDSGSPVGSIGPADTTPLAFKKRTLPSSPYPQRQQTPSREPSVSNLSNPVPAPTPSADPAHRRVPSSVPQNTFPDEDDQFDYIAAYVNNMGADTDSGSPSGEDYGRLGQPRVLNESPTSSGYGRGRFTTNLESGGFR